MRYLTLVIMFFLAAPVYGQGCNPSSGCFGIIGYNPQTAKKFTYVNYSDINTPAQKLQQDCPNCEYAYFRNTCAVLVYSPTHNFSVFETAWYEDIAKKDAIEACKEKLKEIGLKKVATGTDKRRSVRQHGETGKCLAVHSACTQLPKKIIK